MKTYSQFIAEAKKAVEPVMITAIPSHGAHAVKTLGLNENSIFDNLNDYWTKHHENSHLGDSDNDVHNNIKVSERKFLTSTGGPEHHSAVHDYTNSSYDINSKLAKVKDGGFNAHEKHLLGLLDHATTKNKLTHDLHVYHGLDTWDPGKEASKHPEGHVKIPTFLSTSHSKKSAVEFAHMRGEHQDPEEAEHRAYNKGHVLHIHLKKGQKGLYIGDHSAQTNITGHNEHEFLLPRNQTLKIHPHHTELAGGVKVWHATVHDEKPKGTSSPQLKKYEV